MSAKAQLVSPVATPLTPDGQILKFSTGLDCGGGGAAAGGGAGLSYAKASAPGGVSHRVLLSSEVTSTSTSCDTPSGVRTFAMPLYSLPDLLTNVTLVTLNPDRSGSESNFFCIDVCTSLEIASVGGGVDVVGGDGSTGAGAATVGVGAGVVACRGHKTTANVTAEATPATPTAKAAGTSQFRRFAGGGSSVVG
ncbi:hypothetical protein CG716_04865 [Mycolicibacterium sphagni]|uniref:Uncharacterized protein n=1 Tax=Mycolicibacterium sphagni TaxID=1786 RepID=A0A255DWR2_9MYCO|nr:hypothetical protein CG716_04865 [Mycolicibacterium sphagni]